MDKIWIIYNEKYYNRKFMVYKDESTMLRNLKPNSNTKVIEYELKSSSYASDYLKSRERDKQLSGILGELSEYELNAIKLTQLYESFPDIHINDRYIKSRILRLLKCSTSNKKSFSNVLTNNKTEFLSVCESVEWLTLLLKCHNFRDCNSTIYKYDYDTKKIINEFKVSDELKKNFKIAKESLKIKNMNKKNK